MKETDLTRELCKMLERAGAVVFACVGAGFQGRGWPDRHIDHKLWSGWIEFKKDQGALRPMQRVKLESIWKAGGSALIARFLTVTDCILIQAPIGCGCMTRIQLGSKHCGREFLIACEDFTSASRARHLHNQPCVNRLCYIHNDPTRPIYYEGNSET